MKDNIYFFGTGRRKTCIAQVRIFKGVGKFIQKKNEKDILLGEKDIGNISEPFDVLSAKNQFDTTIVLNGGGISSKIDATKLAIARALSKIDKDFEKTLKKEGLLTRDSREKERKKPGLKRARRAPQWAKR